VSTIYGNVHETREQETRIVIAVRSDESIGTESTTAAFPVSAASVLRIPLYQRTLSCNMIIASYREGASGHVEGYFEQEKNTMERQERRKKTPTSASFLIDMRPTIWKFRIIGCWYSEVNFLSGIACKFRMLTRGKPRNLQATDG